MKQARRRLPRLTPWNVVQLLVIVVFIVLLVLSQVVQPVDPYHRAALATLQSALDELPPYPDSVASTPMIKAGPLDYHTTLFITYGTTAVCTDIQTYYATTAVPTGWQVERPVLTIRTGQPPADELHGSYRKREQGFTVELIIECFVDTAVQSGYTLSLQTPPDAPSSAVWAEEARLASLPAGVGPNAWPLHLARPAGPSAADGLDDAAVRVCEPRSASGRCCP
jgi:hypothetical protein